MAITENQESQRWVIVGAGLAGSLLAIILAKKGFRVDVYEKRSDMRLSGVVGGRSINLALSNRGLSALQKVGLRDAALQMSIPMHSRCIHTLQGQTLLQAYGTKPEHNIYSISRGGLNMLLLTAAEDYPNVQLHFNMRCTAYDINTGEVHFVNETNGQTQHIKGGIVIGTDGAGSAVRDAMLRQPGFDFSQNFLAHGYKELIMPAKTAVGDARFAMEKNALHIWPRGQYMLIALPNFDGSFTCTLFLAHKDDANSFAHLQSDGELKQFFETNFADVPALMPQFVNELNQHPVGYMATIKSYPWYMAGNAGGKALLIGDSAHAIVPFYGQGMNCAFEDCNILGDLLENYGADYDAMFTKFQKLRKQNTDAIADLALANFIEMRDHTANPIFMRKRQAELLLEKKFPDTFFSKYSMVTFYQRPYKEALDKGNIQDAILMQMCSEIDSIDSFDAEGAMAKINNAFAQAGLA